MAADSLQCPLRSGWIAVRSQPSRAFGHNKEAKNLGHGNTNANTEDPSPGVTVAQEVTQRLRGEDADVDRYLCHSTKEASLIRWGDFADVQRNNDRRCASTGS